MKQLYTLLLFCLMVSAASGAWAQVRSSNTAPIYTQARDLGSPGDRIIDPRSDVKLFPNPAVEYLIVEIKSEELRQVSFELNNIIGNTFEIRSEALDGNRYKIYVKDLRPGYYFITLKDGNSSYKRSYRFLKK